jgi:hypothetical protein
LRGKAGSDLQLDNQHVRNPRGCCYYHSNMNGTAYGVRIMVMCAENAHATTNPSVDADKHLRSIGGISRIVQYRG